MLSEACVGANAANGDSTQFVRLDRFGCAKRCRIQRHTFSNRLALRRQVTAATQAFYGHKRIKLAEGLSIQNLNEVRVVSWIQFVRTQAGEELLVECDLSKFSDALLEQGVPVGQPEDARSVTLMSSRELEFEYTASRSYGSAS